MILNQPVPTIKTYHQLLKSRLFRQMELFSNRFLAENQLILAPYSRQWVSDPLHQWSRQYEYPFVYNQIRHFIKKHPNRSRVKVLDAGSGVTFLPYFLTSNFSSLIVDCCDRDPLLKQIFSKIKKKSSLSVNFYPVDLYSLPFDQSSYDIVYCISVLEHTKDFEKIVGEFKRVLKPKGHLIVSLDVSLDNSGQIPLKEIPALMEKFKLFFHLPKSFEMKQTLKILNSNQILTTQYIKKFNPDLLPWKYPRLSALKSLLKFRLPQGWLKNLTCFCVVFTNQ